jgi:hypothetical protein
VSEGGLGEDQQPQYDIVLTCTNKAPAGGGGGGAPPPGDFPHQVICQTATLVQSASAGASTGFLTVTLPGDPTPGNLLVAKMWIHSVAPSLFDPPPGFTGHPDGPLVPVNAGSSNADGEVQIYYRVVESGDAAAWTTGALFAATVMLVEEFAGSWEVSDHDFHDDTGVTGVGDRPCALGSVDVAGTSLVVGAAVYNTDGGTEIAAATYSIDVGTVDFHGPSSVQPSGPSFASSWQATAATATISPTITQNAASARAGTGGLILAFACTQSAAQNPPTPGQPFGPVIPEETPNGVITTFTLPAGYEFADGSLHIQINGLPSDLMIASYDGAARTFTLTAAPLVGWTVKAWGVGR